MGYTHYYKHKKTLDYENWLSFCVDVKLLIAASPVLVQFENDFETPPQIDGEVVRFNGVGEEGHETFHITRQACDFTFCKTARKPYDTLVVACLVMLKIHFRDAVDVSLDGFWSDWGAGVALCRAALPDLRDQDVAFAKEYVHTRDNHRE